MNLLFLPRWLVPLALLLVPPLLLVACGGVDSGGTGMEPPTTYAAGSISGFGSIVINEVHYDESGASVQADDGTVLSGSDLKLGMQTELLASPITVTAGVSSAVASQILVRNSVLGPVESIDLANSRMTVLGQSVSIKATTVFDPSLANGLAALSVGDVVEVYAGFDVSAQRFVATRVQPHPNAPAYQLRGMVAALSLSAKTLRVGALTVDWSQVAPANPETVLAVGRFVRLTLATSPASGVRLATGLVASQPMLADRDSAEVEGRITAWTSALSFMLNGIPVDASQARFPNGMVGVVLGAKVQVEGSVRSGVLVAARVSVESDDGSADGFGLHGAITAVDSAAQSFVVRGVTVVWSSSTRFDGGTPASIKVGSLVEVHGALSTDGTRIDASTIEVDN